MPHFTRKRIPGGGRTCSASFWSMTARRAQMPIAPCAAPRSRQVTSGRSVRNFATAAGAVSPVIQNWGNFSSNIVRGPRHETPNWRRRFTMIAHRYRRLRVARRPAKQHIIRSVWISATRRKGAEPISAQWPETAALTTGGRARAAQKLATAATIAAPVSARRSGFAKSSSS